MSNFVHENNWPEPKQSGSVSRPSMLHRDMDDTDDQSVKGGSYTSKTPSLASSLLSLSAVSSISSASSPDPCTPSSEQPDFPPSHFPCLDSRPGISTSWQSTEVPFKDIDRLQSFCNENDVSTLAVFQVAWAFVLRCYLANPSVCFTCSSSEAKDGTGNMPEYSPTPSVCQVDFSPETSVMDLLTGTNMQSFPIPFRPMRTQSLINEHPTALPLNTSLVYRREKQSNWSGVVRPAAQVLACTGLVNV